MNVTDAALEAAAAGCPNLQNLDLRGCKTVSGAGLKVVAAGCPNLQQTSSISTSATATA